MTTPAVRRMASEYKVDLRQIVPTGRDGRVLKEDVLNHLSLISSGGKESKVQTEAERAESRPPGQAVLLEDRSETIKGITKSMFKTMTASLSVPHFGLSEEIDLTQLVKLRPELKQISAERGTPISYVPFFIKAASLALNQFPILNATIDKNEEKIVYKASHNIGVAMDTKHGLLVPNIKGVNSLGVLDIARELVRLQELGKNGQLGTNELSGGTFTLSNIGSVCLSICVIVSLH